MAKEHGALTHHEALRYDYLSKNIHFLNDRDKQELAFLKAKMEGRVPTKPQARPVRQIKEAPKKWQDRQQLPNYPAAKNHLRTEEQVSRLDQETEVRERANGLPTYPNGEAPRRPRRQKSLRQKAVTPEKALPETPKKPKKKRSFSFKRVFQVILLIILATLIGMVIMFFKGVNDVTSDKENYSPAQTEVFNGEDTADGTNILILGSDKRVTQNSTDARTDTIMVMNIGGKDGKIKLASFMRDTLVNIPGYSENDYSTDLKLNSSFNLGEQDDNQGVEYVRQVLKHNFDIDIKYYVMVDFETFAEAIDTLFPEGVTIDAQFETIGGEDVTEVQVPDDLGYAKGGEMYQTITEGEQQMDGKTLLNYARFRGDDTADFGRVQRQQQVMKAIMSQIKNPTKLFTGSAALGKIYALTSTNISYPRLLSEGLGVLTSGKGGIEQVTIPQEGDWIDDYDLYGGMALNIDRDKYKDLLADMGMR